MDSRILSSLLSFVLRWESSHPGARGQQIVECFEVDDEKSNGRGSIQTLGCKMFFSTTDDADERGLPSPSGKTDNSPRFQPRVADVMRTKPRRGPGGAKEGIR